MTLAHVYTVAFEGIEAREVDVQVHIGEGGAGVFTVVGLADKAVGESRERVRAALAAVGLALPWKRITVNLAPADVPKEGSHYDLPIALALLAAMGVLPGCRGPCSTASTFTSKWRACRRPISPFLRPRKAPLPWPRASPERATFSVRATPRRACAPMPKPKASCWTEWQRPMRRARSFSPKRPSVCG